MPFKFSHNTSNPNAKPREYEIATGTAIEEGEIVDISAGLIIAHAGPTDFDDPALGAAAEPHDGSTADFIGRQTGTKIRIYDDPNDVFELKQDAVETLTGGSTTTALIATLGPATDDVWIGGYVEIVTCAANSDLIGKMVKITDSAQATGTLTLAETLPSALAADDTVKLYPGPRLLTQFGWDLNSDGTDVDYSSTGGQALQLVDVDPEKKKSFWKIRLHKNGNYVGAIDV